MEPKFQSSFIPKGPVGAATQGAPTGRSVKEKNLFYFLASLIFSISIILALGMLGYKYYLKYAIAQMGEDLKMAQASIQKEEIDELTRINNRLTASKKLIEQHQIISPFFSFLEASAPKAVRFDKIQYTKTEQGIELLLMGEARGYTALAFQADVFKKSQYFKDSNFYNLNLSDKGDVRFAFKALVDENLVSYQKEIERSGATPILETKPVATSTDATTIPN